MEGMDANKIFQEIRWGTCERRSSHQSGHTWAWLHQEGMCTREASPAEVSADWGPPPKQAGTKHLAGVCTTANILFSLWALFCTKSPVYLCSSGGASRWNKSSLPTAHPLVTRWCHSQQGFFHERDKVWMSHITSTCLFFLSLLGCVCSYQEVHFGIQKHGMTATD